VTHHDSTLLEDIRAALAPTGQLGDEVGWRHQLDVDVEIVLDTRDPAQQFVVFGLEPKVDVDSRGAPAFDHGGRTTCQVERRGFARHA
jgi:hypothetical protein